MTHEEYIGELRTEIERLQHELDHWEQACNAAAAMIDMRDAEIKRLGAELARWKPPYCGKIFPFPRPGEVVLNCRREVDHDGAHQTETGEVWVFTNDEQGYV